MTAARPEFRSRGTSWPPTGSNDIPILEVPAHPEMVEFTFDGRTLEARKSEMISSALFANGIQVFGRHRRDGSPQGIFCANGQCAQCLVVADGLPVKACITPCTPGMDVRPIEGLPELMADDSPMRLRQRDPGGRDRCAGRRRGTGRADGRGRARRERGARAFSATISRCSAGS